MARFPTVSGAFWFHESVRACAYFADIALAALVLPFLALFPLRLCRRDTLLWCPVPYKPFREWSLAMRQAGHASVTLVDGHWFPWSTKEDFDMDMSELVPRYLWPLRNRIKYYAAFLYILRNASVMHTAMGGPLEATPLWRFEPLLLRRAGIRTVCIPLGCEGYPSSRIADPSLRHGLLMAFPATAKNEERVLRNIRLWTKHADVIITSLVIDALGRWDVLSPNPCVIDVATSPPKIIYGNANGANAPVHILHAPSHRGYKGTEFIKKAVSELAQEGLKIDFELVEYVPNAVVRERMLRADILVDECIVTGYGMAAIEGMASGIPVLSNLEHAELTSVFRRYSFLGESPIVSTSPESMKDNLRMLITRPELRTALGHAGRMYAEKYHSYDAANFLFSAVYERILKGNDIDLLRLYHPLEPSLPPIAAPIDHPFTRKDFPVAAADFAEAQGMHASRLTVQSASPRMQA